MMSVRSAHQGCIYLIKSTVQKKYNFNIFRNVIISVMAKLRFQQHDSSLQCHMILKKSF